MQKKSDLYYGISKLLPVTLESCSKLENVSGAENPHYTVTVQLLLVDCFVQELSLRVSYLHAYHFLIVPVGAHQSNKDLQRQTV